MKALFLDCTRGVAGDMVTAALYGLLSPKEQSAFLEKMNSLKKGVEVKASQVLRSGIGAVKIDVVIDGKKEGESVAKGKGKAHAQTTLDEIKAIVDGFDVSDKVKGEVKRIYENLADAESKAHSTPVSEVHFHEVGMMDAIFDITGSAILMEMLAPETVSATGVCTGYGSVKCAHGTMPIPTPATSELLSGIPVSSGDVEGELCTPTGAAIVRYFVDEFGRMPDIIIKHTSYGAGTKELTEGPNVLRAVIGELTKVMDTTHPDPNQTESRHMDTVIQLSFNVDDMTGEDISYACDKIRRAGAREVFTTAINMKKGRPGVLISVLCYVEMEDEIVQLIFKHTTTLGIRRQVCDRIILERKTTEEYVDDRIIRVKTATGYNVKRTKPEFEDIKALADETGESIEEVRRRLFR